MSTPEEKLALMDDDMHRLYPETVGNTALECWELHSAELSNISTSFGGTESITANSAVWTYPDETSSNSANVAKAEYLASIPTHDFTVVTNRDTTVNSIDVWTYLNRRINDNWYPRIK